MGLLYKSDVSVGGKTGEPKKTAIAPGESAEQKIAAYNAMHPKMSGFIFDIPHDAAEDEAVILSDLMKSAVSSIGIAVSVRSDPCLMRTLVLIPASLDRELVSHRIRANFQIKSGCAFSAASMNDIKTAIKDYSAYLAGVRASVTSSETSGALAH
jgi:hypothetical protein